MYRVNTPLRVSHNLVMEIWFAIEGEDEWGNPCEDYKTRVRTLTLRKPVMIPSVRDTPVAVTAAAARLICAVCTYTRICRSPDV